MPEVDHKALPFQPAFGSSMRPSTEEQPIIARPASEAPPRHANFTQVAQGDSIMQQYEREFENLGLLSAEVERLLTRLLADTPARIHSIGTRLKSKDSLERKLAKAPGTYSELKDITDLCGARVITYFEDQVAAVANIIEREFAIDWPNSIDKRKALEPDRFGYASVHYVASLSKDRMALTEYKRLRA